MKVVNTTKICYYLLVKQNKEINLEKKLSRHFFFLIIDVPACTLPPPVK